MPISRSTTSTKPSPAARSETEVLTGITVAIEKGEYVSIIGHSGCGKSTLLNIVAGLTPVTRGAVLLENKEVNEPGPDRAVVFQNHSLLPWLTVYDNVRLAVDKVFSGTKSRKERHAWTMHNLELVQMAHAKDKRPMEISGGMKQRVGIARALAMEPKVLLLDEPFGALDALTRAHLQDSVMAIHAKLENTVLMITHDVDEAVLLSDRIVMMTNGPAARIGEVLDVPLPRPRRRLELVGRRRLHQGRQRVIEFLYARHRPRSAGRGVGRWLTRAPGRHRPSQAGAEARRVASAESGQSLTRTPADSALGRHGARHAGALGASGCWSSAAAWPASSWSRSWSSCCPGRYEIVLAAKEPHRPTTACCCRACWPARRRRPTSSCGRRLVRRATASRCSPASRPPRCGPRQERGARERRAARLRPSRAGDGLQAIRLPIPGRHLAGVTTFRDLDDVDALRRAAAGAPAVVIGGGLLGIEAACGLARRGARGDAGAYHAAG